MITDVTYLIDIYIFDVIGSNVKAGSNLSVGALEAPIQASWKAPVRRLLGWWFRRLDTRLNVRLFRRNLRTIP